MSDGKNMMRIYLCAAAGDMAAERELMHTYVLPELKDRLVEHGIEIAIDDPRADDGYLSLSAAERAAEAFDRIDRARPWFVAFVGDAVDEAPIALPADVLARHPWLAEQQGASALELELIYGALEGSGNRQAIVYVRDDRFLRDVPFDLRHVYSSEDLVAVGRLETLKSRLRDAGVQLVDGYSCRWDAASGRVNDLEELGKQVVEDLYEAILKSEHPEMEIGVLDELPASGAAMGMVNQATEGALGLAATGNADDDLDFAMEDILDIDAGTKESSSASAVEGVEMLDFLDDSDNTSAASASAMEPTINFDAGAQDQEVEDVAFDLSDEILDIDNVEIASEPQSDDGGLDEIITLDDMEIADLDSPMTAAPVAETGDIDIEAMFADVEPIAEVNPDEDSAVAASPPLAADAEQLAAPVSDDAVSDEIVEADLFVDEAEEFAAQPFAAESASGSDVAQAEPTLVWPSADEQMPPEAEPIFAADETNMDPLAGGDSAEALHDDEEMAIDLVADELPLAAASVESEHPQDEVNHIPLSFGEPLNAEESVADAEEYADDDGLGMFLDLPEQTASSSVDSLEQTVRHNAEATEISDVDDDGAPTAVSNDEDEFRLQDEATVAPPAATIVPSSFAETRQPKKKSSLPLILAVLFLLLLVGGGAGAYFAGLIPGLSGAKPPVAEVTAPPANPEADDFVKQLNEHVNKLTELYRAAKPANGGIDQAKIQEAQTLIAQLEANKPELAKEEPIQAHKTRFTALVADAEKQAVAQAETKRHEDFRSALELAGANSPESLDESYLEDARRLAANDDERNLIAALEQQVHEHAEQQARLAEENAGKAKTEALAAVVAATGDAEDYRAAIDAYVTAYPDDETTADLQAALQTEPATLDAVSALNKLAADWAKLDMRKLSAADAQLQLDAANSALARTAVLPGGEEIAARSEMLQPIAKRTAPPQLSGGAIDAPLVLAMKDGRRFYLTAKPAAKDGKIIASYVIDAADASQTAEAEIVAAEIDREHSAPSTLPQTAKAINETLATATTAWEPAFIKALMTVQNDAKLDPVVKSQWLLIVAQAGAQGSAPLAAVLGDFLKLAETGVDEKFNWADPTAAAAAREKCATALAALPQVRTLAPAVAKSYGELATFSAESLAVPVGVLLKDEAGEWKVQLADNAPQSASLAILPAQTADAPFLPAKIGAIEAGEVVFDEIEVNNGWIQGRVVYAKTN